MMFIICRPLGEDDILIDPSELLGKRLDFQLVLDQCCGLRWVKEARNRGVQIGLVWISAGTLHKVSTDYVVWILLKLIFVLY